MDKRKSIQVNEVEWEVAKRLALEHRTTIKVIVGMAIQAFAAGQWPQSWWTARACGVRLQPPAPLTPEQEAAIRQALKPKDLTYERED